MVRPGLNEQRMPGTGNRGAITTTGMTTKTATKGAVNGRKTGKGGRRVAKEEREAKGGGRRRRRRTD